jgi:anamorsin
VSTEDIDDTSLPQDFTTKAVVSVGCNPSPGKRRKACEGCTCGLKELEEAEDMTSTTESIPAEEKLQLL